MRTIVYINKESGHKCRVISEFPCVEVEKKPGWILATFEGKKYLMGPDEILVVDGMGDSEKVTIWSDIIFHSMYDRSRGRIPKKNNPPEKLFGGVFSGNDIEKIRNHFMSYIDKMSQPPEELCIPGIVGSGMSVEDERIDFVKKHAAIFVHEHSNMEKLSLNDDIGDWYGLCKNSLDRAVMLFEMIHNEENINEAYRNYMFRINDVSDNTEEDERVNHAE